MANQFSELRCKEVICLCDGQRLGYISDVRIALPEGRVTAVIVPGPCRFLGVWGRKDEYVIPWSCICKIGPDTVLVDADPERCRCPRSKPGLLFG